VQSTIEPADVLAGGPGERLRASTGVAVAYIALLNLADIITTNAVLAHTGALESNPLAAALLSGARVGLIKAGVVLLLVLRVPRPMPTIAFNAVMWFVAGFYFLTALNNLFVLRRVG